jgi:hypothetical protein
MLNSFEALWVIGFLSVIKVPIREIFGLSKGDSFGLLAL